MKPTKAAAAVNGTYYSAGRHLNYKPSDYEEASAAVPGHVEAFLAAGGKIDILPEPEYSSKARAEVHGYGH
jgi:hypothetical protein